MQQFLAWLYTVYGALIFILTGIFFLLPQLILGQRRSWHRIALRMNHYWARTYFFLLFFRVRVYYDYKPGLSDRFILCANHFSYLDIPVMPLVNLPFKFIGKSAISRYPVFGYMFKKIHVMVDRGSLRSRANSIHLTSKELNDGFSVTFYPEGGVKSTDPPAMVPFRDGAFRLAKEHQLPILPVVLHDNFRIFPDDGKWLLHHGSLRISVLDPIHPESNDEKEIHRLKEATFKALQERLEHPPQG